MPLVIMHMQVSSGKRKELSQAITSLLNFIRLEKGCVRCVLFHGVEDENVLCLLQEWETWNDLETHRGAEFYKVKQGAMHLMEEPLEIIICQRFQSAGKLQRNGLEIQEEN